MIIFPAKVDVALVFVATSSSEGSDRKDLSLDNGQDELVSLVAEHNSKTAVVRPDCLYSSGFESLLLEASDPILTSARSVVVLFCFFFFFLSCRSLQHPVLFSCHGR